jgi:hypothetical protein
MNETTQANATAKTAFGCRNGFVLVAGETCVEIGSSVPGRYLT